MRRLGQWLLKESYQPTMPLACGANIRLQDLICICTPLLMSLRVMSSIGQASTTTIPSNLGEHMCQVGKLSSEHLMPAMTLASMQTNLTSGSILKSEMLEVIHHFLVVLDGYFSNVCELDLIFNFHKGIFYSGRGTACRSYSGDEQESCKAAYSCIGVVVEGSSTEEWRRHRKPQFSMTPQL